MKDKKKYAIGFDLGGTKLAAALVDTTGKVIEYKKISVLEAKKDPKKGPQIIVTAMGQMAYDLFTDHKKLFTKTSPFVGVGLASAGPLNVKNGELIHPVNFPKWKVVPIQSLLQKELTKRGLKNCPVFFQNDAIAASFSEYAFGAAQGLKSFAVVTIGTGIGTGVIFNNQPLQTNGMGSEFGHLIYCGPSIIDPKIDLKNYTIEGIASGTGILRRAQHEYQFKGQTTEELTQAILEGDKKYQILFDQAAHALAVLIYNLSIGLNLEKVLLSGGLIKVKHLYFDQLKKHYQDLITNFNPQFKTKIQIAQTQNNAGVLGAAALAFFSKK